MISFVSSAGVTRGFGKRSRFSVILPMLSACFGQNWTQLRQPMQFGLVPDKLNVPPGTDLHTGAAADARVVCRKCLHTVSMSLAEAFAHQLKDSRFGRSLLTASPCKDQGGHFGCLFVDAGLRSLRRCRREGQIVRHEPDRRGMVGDSGPIVQVHNLVQLMQTAAKIAGKLLNGKAVGIGRDLNSPDIVFHIAGQAAGHAGEDETDALCLCGIRFGRKPAHHDNIGIAELAGDAFCHVQAVSRPAVAIDDVLAHGVLSFSVYIGFFKAESCG